MRGRTLARRVRDPRRGAERHRAADEDVPHAPRRELAGGDHRRQDADRPAAGARRAAWSQIERILPGIDGIAFHYLNDADVVRHRLVRDIIKAYADEVERVSAAGRRASRADGVRRAVAGGAARRAPRVSCCAPSACGTRWSPSRSSPRARIAALDARHLGQRGPTDVISFGFVARARRSGRRRHLHRARGRARERAPASASASREELVRLVVHGVLHALGHDHPDGDARCGRRCGGGRKRSSGAP